MISHGVREHCANDALDVGESRIKKLWCSRFLLMPESGIRDKVLFSESEDLAEAGKIIDQRSQSFQWQIEHEFSREIFDLI